MIGETSDAFATWNFSLASRRVATVAVAVAGELRTLPRAVPNWQASLLRPLSADLYMDVSATSTWTAANKEARVAGNRLARAGIPPHLLHQRGIRALLEALRPRHFVLDPMHAARDDEATYSGLFSRWVRLYAAIVHHERQSAARYEWIVRVRADLIFACRVTPDFLSAAAPHSVLKWDLIAAFPRHAAEAALTFGSRRKNCVCRAYIDACVQGVLFASNLSFYHVGAHDRRANLDGRCEGAACELDRHPELIVALLRRGDVRQTGVADGARSACSVGDFRRDRAALSRLGVWCRGQVLTSGERLIPSVAEPSALANSGTL